MAVGDIIQEVLLAASEWKHCDDNNHPAIPKCLLTIQRKHVIASILQKRSGTIQPKFPKW